MAIERKDWHIICERDVGLFSLIQQVIAHIPLAFMENRIPIALFGPKCCYWTEKGYQSKKNVWEYYFEPIIADFDSSEIDSAILSEIKERPPYFQYPGYFIGENTFVSNHFGDHKLFKKKTIWIPYKWKDPNIELRTITSELISKYVRPRSYITEKVNRFIDQHFNDFTIGVHVRATDVTDINENNVHRRGSYKFDRYVYNISHLLKSSPTAKLFVATDSQKALDGLKEKFGVRIIHSSSVFHTSSNVAGKGPTGWVIPGYLANDANQAAKNGEEAVIDYLILSECDYLIHNGSALARTVLLKNPELGHCNIHTKESYIKSLLKSGYLEIFQFMRFSLMNVIYNVKKHLNRFIAREHRY